MEKDTYRSQFRLPWDLYENISNAAKQSGRSLNAEVVARLAASLSANQDPSHPTSDESNFYQFVVQVFRDTSDDFDGELLTRMKAFLEKMPREYADKSITTPVPSKGVNALREALGLPVKK